MPVSPPETQTRGFIIPIGGAEAKGKNSKILSRFVELCGGPDARILVIPTASLLNETGLLYKELFESMGANSMCVPIENRNECFNQETLRVLGSATGIFVTGLERLQQHLRPHQHQPQQTTYCFYDRSRSFSNSRSTD